MSPQLRSMLEDAADDSGRPTIDLEGIRAAGRRAVWRRRGIAGGLGVGVTAVITTVAVVVGSGGVGQTNDAPSATELEAAGLSASAAPLIAAIEAAGYEVDLGATSSSGSGGPSESGAADSTSGMSLLVTRGDTSGTLLLTEFSSVDAFAGLISTSTPDGVVESVCAMTPPGSGELAFTWGTCDGESSQDATVSWIEGTGTGMEAVGSTVVLADDSGFSVTIATTPSETGFFSYEPLPQTVTASAPLTALPLTAHELADVMAEIAADGKSLLSTEPSPDGSSASGDPCAGDVVAELSDALGRTELVDAQGQRIVCSYDLESDFPVYTMYMSEFPAYDPPLEPWQFGNGLVAYCGGTSVCTEGMLTAVGSVPEGVTRITFEPVDGPIAEATIVDGIYFARVAPSLGDNSVLAPTIVRVYDAAGTLLLEGDATAPGGPGDEPQVTGTPDR